MSERNGKSKSQQDVERLKQEIEETYRGVLELVYEMAEPGGREEIDRLRHEVRKLTIELDETYRGVIELATTLESDERRIRSLTECSGLGLWHWTLASDALTVNQEWLTIAGLSDGEFGGTLRDWDRRIHPHDLPAVQLERQRFLQGERPFFHAEFRLEHMVGDWQWVLTSARASNSQAGQPPLEISGTMLNIHTRKETELQIQQLNLELEQRNQERSREIEHINHQLLEEVRQHQRTVQALRQINRQAEQANQEVKQLSERLSLAVRSARIGIWELDLIHNHLVWDDRMYTLYGLTRDNTVSTFQSWEQCIHPDDLPKANAAMQQAIHDNIDIDIEFRVIWPDGAVRTLQATAMVQYDEHGKAMRMIGINYDITDRKQMEQDLLDAKSSAEAANQSKSIFLANMSHELRTPLQAILGFSQLMQLDNGLSEKYLSNLAIINRSGTHLHALINDVLEVSEIESGRVEARLFEFDLYELLEEIQAMFKLQLNSKNITLNASIGHDVPQHLTGDAGKLRQILINLLGNAVKFTNDGGIDLQVDINDQHQQLRFDIIDTGPGIRESEFERLFQPFEQGLAGLAKGGTGLGLVISREYIHLLGGEIFVRSSPGEGSCFSFTFPYQLSLRPIHRAQTRNKTVIGLSSGAGSRLALVVDDHLQSLAFMVQLLEKLGFRTLQATDGKQALNEIRLNRPDVVLLDLLLPDMDGCEVTQQIKTSDHTGDIPVIMVTAGANSQTMQKAYQCGVSGFLTKPCKLTDIINALEAIPSINLLYDNESTGHELAPRSTLNRKSLLVIPAELRLKLRTATESGDIQQLRTCLDDIEQSNHGLAHDIGRLVDRFDYDTLLEILN